MATWGDTIATYESHTKQQWDGMRKTESRKCTRDRYGARHIKHYPP